MIEVEETSDGLRVWDSGNNELFIETVDWIPLGNSSKIERVDKEIRGLVTELIFPADVLSVKNLDNNSWETHGSRIGRISLNSNCIVQIHSSIVVYVLIKEKAKIETNGRKNQLLLSFPKQTGVELGFRARFRQPTEVLRVPKSPEGLAFALTQTSKCFDTNSPDRSYPSLRSHPQRISTVEEYDLELNKQTSHLNKILFKVPERYEELFVISPLAHYLQADIRTGNRNTVKISIPDESFSIEFSKQPSLENESNQMLRRVFMLDCLVRDFGRYKTNLVERSLLKDIGLSGRELYDLRPESRIVKYTEADFREIQHELPKWHLSMHVEPNSASIEALPYILDRLGAVYTPKSKNVSDLEIIHASLDETKRSSSKFDNTSINLKKPILKRAQTHGWLSEDIPFDAFKASTISFENRFKYQQNTDNHTMKVIVVLNEHDMREEFAHVYDIFSSELNSTNYNVMVHDNVRKNELKNIIENENTDFLHYIGHCDSDGLRCVDGNLSMQSLNNSKVQTFFLNACGSINEGLSLIEKGSVAGAVTLRPVLDKPAAKVGTTFAKLVINGFAFDKGLDIARKRIIMHKFYTVVGDGTHRLTNGTDPFPIILHINALENDTFRVSSVISSPQIAGASYQPKLKGKREFRLIGNETIDILTRDDLIEFLEESNSPAIFEDEFLWTDEVVERLC